MSSYRAAKPPAKLSRAFGRYGNQAFQARGGVPLAPERKGHARFIAPHSLAAAIHKGDPVFARFRHSVSSDRKMTLRFYVDVAIVEEINKIPNSYSYARIHERDFPTLADMYYKIRTACYALNEDQNYFQPRLDARFLAKTSTDQNFEFRLDTLSHYNLRSFLESVSRGYSAALRKAEHGVTHGPHFG